MALIITKNLNVMGGINISQIYIRFSYKVPFSGNEIYVNIMNFLSSDSYDLNQPNSGLPIDGIPEYINFNYVREEDGIDTLGFIHQKFKDYLSTDQTAESLILDPSTGRKQYDPSTGELLTETIVSVERFAEADEIKFIDVSIG